MAPTQVPDALAVQHCTLPAVGPGQQTVPGLQHFVIPELLQQVWLPVQQSVLLQHGWPDEQQVVPHLVWPDLQPEDEPDAAAPTVAATAPAAAPPIAIMRAQLKAMGTSSGGKLGSQLVEQAEVVRAALGLGGAGGASCRRAVSARTAPGGR